MKYLKFVGGEGLAQTLIGVMVPVGVVVTIAYTRIIYKKGWLGEQGYLKAETAETSENTK